MKKIPLRELYQNIGRHLNEPFVITNFNNPVATVIPTDDEIVVLDKQQLNKLASGNRIAFSHQNKIYLVLPVDVADIKIDAKNTENR